MYPTIAAIGLDRTITPEPLDIAVSRRGLPCNELNTAGLAKSVGQVRNLVHTSKFLDFSSSIIQNILWAVDANTFASLCLLNQRWYREAQIVELYAHHLSRCPSYALSNSVITGPFRDDDLYTFKARFAAEVRRNLFDAYTRPRRTFFKLISISANSSAAFPGGEAFRFEFSPSSRTILALSSSRIYVMDATSDTLIVKRELKTLRRPLSASITDDGTLLAVLSSRFQANVYGLPPTSKIKHLQVIVLDNSPRTIAIAHEGTVLAAAYDTGVEVFSLAANALSTDRRAVRSEAVDTLSFSSDGSMLVGSSLNLEEPNAVVISAPFYTENDPDLTPREMHSRMWTTQILFPQISSVCSHVALLPGHSEGEATWLFAYDHSLLSYRAVRTDDTRAGVAYFLGPPTANRFSLPSPTIAPMATHCGTLAVAGFSGSGICLYGVPQKLDLGPDMAAVVERHERRLQAFGRLTTATGNIEPLMAYSPSMSGVSELIEDDTIASKVDWRQSIFVKCKPIETLHGHTAAKWVERQEHVPTSYNGKRLLVVAPGGVGSTGGDFGEEPVPLDGSRLCFLDFDYGPSTREDREITVEVGENEPELLVEHTGSIATEVAMERRRTIRGMPGGANARAILGRSITAISPSNNFIQDDRRRQSISQPSTPTEEPVRLKQPIPGLMHRSASVSGFRNALYPPRPPLGSQQYMNPGVGEHGRAPSVDSWETPPPPYIDTSRMNAPPGQQSIQPLVISSTAGGVPPRNTPAVNQVQSANLHRPLQSRISTGMDGMPMIDTGPTRRNMSQYGALARTRLRDQSMTSLNSLADSPAHRFAIRSMDLSSSSSGFNSPGPVVDAYVQRPRPFTHYGSSSDSDSALHRTFSSTISPLSPSDARGTLRSGLVSPDQGPRISLTGANLQNRLNHPVPPVPEEEPSMPAVPEEYRHQISPPQPISHQTSPIPAVLLPSPPVRQLRSQTEQFTDKPRQAMQSPPARKPVPPNNRTVVQSSPEIAVLTSHISPAHPGRSGPAYPTFNQSSDMSDGISTGHGMTPNHQHNDVLSSYWQLHVPSVSRLPANIYPQRNNLASVSTPNLLRPSYNTRLDHLEVQNNTRPSADSPGIAFNIGRRMSRAQSMIQSPLHRERNKTNKRQHREQSAYAETVQTIPDVSSNKGVRKARKKERSSKEDSERGGNKKGSKCNVM